jgi:crotonobetainyl-CoA:carnitine CoA-transferase CaiB-like acyl-CoA transferase
VVSALNPKIIMCSISTFGQTGPLANRPGYDFIGCVYSGVLSMIGDPDSPPVLPQHVRHVCASAWPLAMFNR